MTRHARSAWARRCTFGALLLALLLLLDVALAQDKAPPSAAASAAAAPATAAPANPPDAPAAKRHVIVGTVQIAPFIVKRENGEWTGISMELWKRVARELNLDYEIREYDLKTWRERSVKEADVFVSMNVSEKGEEAWDLTHAFYSTGLAIATSREAKSGLLVLWEGLTSSVFMKGIAVVFLILLVMGTFMWLLERRKNEDEFGGTGGILQGFFWAAETFIGYNDPQHKTRIGRSLGILWAVVSVLALSGFTAEMSSQLTTSRLQTAVSGPNELSRVRVGTLERSQGEKWLTGRGLQCKKYETPEAMIEGLNKHEVDAVVYEAPILSYMINGKYDETLTVLPGTFNNHGYGLGLRTGSDLREQVNLALLRISQSSEFEHVLTEWLGAGGS